jgi:hypothetical protein
MLYGQPGAEIMDQDEETVAEKWYDDGAESDRNTIEEWSTEGGFNQFVMSASSTAEWVAEHANDDIMFEDAGKALMEAAQDPEVIAAFEVAREALTARAGKTWLFADKLLRTGTMIVVGNCPFIEWNEP